MSVSKYEAPQGFWKISFFVAALLGFGYWGYGPSLTDIFEFRSNPKGAIHSSGFHILLFLCLFISSRFIWKSDEPFNLGKNKLRILIIASLGFIPNYLVQREIASAGFTGDELAYLQNSFGYPQIILEGLYETFPAIEILSPVTLLQILSITLVLLSIATISLLNRFELLSKPFTLLVLVLALRIANDYVLNFGSAYPNLYGSFLQVINPAARDPNLLRTLQWIFIGACILYIYDKYWSSSNSATFIFSIFGLSIFGLSSSWFALEPSNFFAISAFAVLTLLIKKPERYVQISILVVTFATFFRATSIVLLPIILLLSIKDVRAKKISHYDFIPLTLLLPYIIETGYQNLSSQFQGTRYSDIPIYSSHDSSILTLLNSVATQFHVFSKIVVILLVFVALCVRGSRYAVISYLFLSLPIYALLTPSATQGLNKYAIEIISPVVLVGVSAFFERLHTLANEYLLTSTLILSACLTFFQVTSITAIDLKVNGWRQVPLVVNYPVENRDAYDYVKKNLVGEDCLNPGTTYGVLPFILSAFEKTELENLRRVFNQSKPIFSWGSPELKLENLSANCLIVDNFPIKRNLESQLKASGWKMIYSKNTNRIGSKTTVWVKSSS